MPTVEFKPFVRASTCTTYDVYCDGECYGFVYRDKGASEQVRMRWEGEFRQPSDAQRAAMVKALEARYANETIHQGQAIWPNTQYHPDLPKTYGAKP